MKETPIHELRAEKQQLHDTCATIIEGAKKENRAMTAAETDQIAKAQIRMHEINNEIALRQGAVEEPERKSGRKQENFSLRRAILSQVDGTELHDADRAVLDEGAKLAGGMDTRGGLLIPVESRAALATSGATGLYDTDYQDVLLPLQQNLVLAAAGATFMTGLRGNIAWPAYSGTTVAWEGETDEAADGTGTVSLNTFKPHRLAAYVDVSKQLLLQENQSVETMLRNSIAQAIAAKIESTAFGGHATAAEMPDGLFTGQTSTAGAALDWSAIVKMETDTETANALSGSLAYIMHPALVGKAKTTVKDASGAAGFIYGEGGGLLNGYRLLRTSGMASGLGTGKKGYGAAFGNWVDYLVAQWGAVEILVDPYTQATKGIVRIVTNSYWDLGKIRDASITTAIFDPAKATTGGGA